jgi:hypothetical protein
VLHANVVEGVHRVEDAYTNWYLLEENGRLTIVDTGVPSSGARSLTCCRESVERWETSKRSS